MKNTLIAYSLVALTTFAFLAGCSDLKDSLPNPSSGALSIHPAGWTTASSSSFHGKAIKDQNWDMKGCQTCHGKTYEGGFTKVSCRTCHHDPAGPESCITCHGSAASSAPPNDLDGRTDKALKTVGAHQIHMMGSSLAGPVLCSECHKVPSTIYDPGHVDSQSPAEISFNNALTNTKTIGVTPVPLYNASNATCGSTYCHGAFKNGNPTFAPVWNDPSGTQMACGTCHGDVTKTTLAEKALPKTTAQGGTHPVYPSNLTCSTCHGDVVDATNKIINPAKHINGKLNLLGAEQSF